MSDAERSMWTAYMNIKARNPSARPAVIISEMVWQEHVEHIAVMNGWKKYHTWNSKHSDPDFPDLIMVKGTRQVVAELKKEGKEPRAGQLQWLAALFLTGAEAFIWQPSDLPYVNKVLQNNERCQSDSRVIAEAVKGKEAK